MAEKALKKVEDQLNCSVCLDIYTDPKLLQCLHVFCKTCLVRLVFRDEHGQLVLSCPNCRQITPVPANGVAGLQPAFHIIPILEMAEDLRREKEAPASAEKADSSSASLPPPRNQPVQKGHTVALQAFLHHEKRSLLSAQSMSKRN